jgi:hypothetical protein
VVTGKRAKTRIVPLLPRCARRSSLSRTLSLRRAATAPVPRRARRPLRGEIVRRAVRRARARSACPSGPRRTPCATASPPICSAAAPICDAAGAARPRQPVVDPDLHRGRRAI